MAERVDLEQLRERLAKLGVHIDAPHSRSPASSPDQRAQQRTCKVPDTAWETHLERNSKEVAQLLERCNKVHQALHMSDASDDDAGSVHEQSAKRTDTSRAAAATRAAAAAVKAAAAAVGSNKPAAAGTGMGSLLKPAAGRAIAGASSSKNKVAAAVAAVSSAAAPAKPSAADADSSKLLVRAAHRLLRNAQAEAQQVDRALSTAAPQQQQQQQLVVAGRAGAAAVDQQHRGTPLGTVLAQYKEAQAAWAQEKAKLRREAVANRKKASKLELELARITRAQQHAALDVSTLKAALKGRDVALSEAQQRCKDLEETLARSQEVAAEKLCSLARERDDLQALLLATLQRLEGVEAVVAAADAASAAMEDKVRVLEAERAAALDAAAAARAEVHELQEAQRRLTWQSQLLEKMSEVQLRHNKRKSAAIKELLTSAAAGGPGGKAAAAAGSSRAGSKGRSPGGPSAVLQGMLDELLEGGGDDDYEGDSCCGAEGPARGRIGAGMHGGGDVSMLLSDEGDEAASLYEHIGPMVAGKASASPHRR